MKFNETFEELCDLYTEGLWANINAKKKRGGKSSHGNSDAHKAAVKAGNKLEKGKSSDEEEDAEGLDYRGRTPETQELIKQRIAQFKKNSAKLAEEEPIPTIGTTGGASPEPRKRSEDNETVKKAIKGTAKLAGKSALAFADYMTGGDVSKGIDFVKSSYEDCETCGCEENPEYGHFDDTYSSYIDQYEAEDGEREDGTDDGECESCGGGGCEDCNGSGEESTRQLMMQMAAEDAERVDKDKMKCNSPKRGGSKKFVVKACENGKEKIVRFGDPNMRIRKSNPKARKSFRARHKCDQKKSKFSAGYWSCKKW